VGVVELGWRKIEDRGWPRKTQKVTKLEDGGRDCGTWNVGCEKMILPLMIAALLLFEDTKSTFGIPQVCQKAVGWELRTGNAELRTEQHET
jgi:hypothetical protein